MVAKGESLLPVISPIEYTYMKMAIQNPQKPSFKTPITGGTIKEVGTSFTNKVADLTIAIASLILFRLQLKINY
jgi:hypothetical protein